MGKTISTGRLAARALALGVLASSLGGCLSQQAKVVAAAAPGSKVVARPTRVDRECLTRAMYFEAHRSSEDGLLAVGTVVMNRLDSPEYPNTLCGVVGQPRQFADGVLTKPMRDAERQLVDRVAEAVLAGQRHKEVGASMHFHVAGRSYGYSNMRYVAVAGGNRFYLKTDRAGNLPGPIPPAAVKTADGKLVPLRTALAEATTADGAEQAKP